ncbi:MAG: hypothetical protein HOA17_01825 [Candidatus Melainabacteria bacterium]|jgi:hypothetical protein|nr:hypothetical protein [Candidatus Melainabacteria bacterium]
MDNDVTWAYNFANFDAARIADINDVSKTVYIDLIRTQKKLLVVFVVLVMIIFTIVNQDISGIYHLVHIKYI